MSNPTQELIPWERSKSSGYAGLDLSLSLGHTVGTIAVKRQRPTDSDPGKWIAWHNDTRISDQAHDLRITCQAEAERYMYSLPQFAKSGVSALLFAMVEAGRDAFRDGKSIYQNPHPADKPDAREHWVQGWLESYGGTVAAKAINVATQTARAMSQLQSDMNHIEAVNRVHRFAIEYALQHKDTTQSFGYRFLELFAANDGDELKAAFPDWPSYVMTKSGSAITVEEPTKQ